MRQSESIRSCVQADHEHKLTVFFLLISDIISVLSITWSESFALNSNCNAPKSTFINDRKTVIHVVTMCGVYLMNIH